MSKNTSFKLALMLSTALCINSVQAQYKTVKQDPIGEEESLTTIAAKSIRVVPEGLGDGKEQDPANQREIKYTLAVEKAFEDQVRFKNKVIDSTTFEYDKTETRHEEDFYGSVHKAYDAQKFEIVLTKDNPLRSISKQIFKASSNHLAKSAERGEWMPDKGETKKFFTFVKNHKGQLSLLINDLDMVLPLYSEQRVMPRENDIYAYAPEGKAFTAKQRNAVLFLNRLLAEKPANRFKSGLLYLIQNPHEPFSDLWNKMDGKNVMRLPAQRDIEKYTFTMMSPEDRALCLQSLIFSTYWKDIYALTDAVGIPQKWVEFLDHNREASQNGLHMGSNNLLAYSYKKALHIKDLIRTKSWNDVYEEADKLGIPRDRTKAYYKNDISTITQYVANTNALLDVYHQAVLIKNLMLTKSWDDVYSVTDSIPMSRDHVIFINKHRDNLTYDMYIKAINPFSKMLKGSKD